MRWLHRRSSSDVPSDCLECRLIGTGSMLAISGYFAYLSRHAPALQTQSRFTAALSVVFAAAGVARFFA